MVLFNSVNFIQELCMRWILTRCPLPLLFALALASSPLGRAQFTPSSSALSVPQSALIQPEELVRMLKSTAKEKPLILQVGSRLMFAQAHIPGSEYAGPGSQESGIQSLESMVSSVSKKSRIILYCGCCPWNRCPNVGPAYKRLHDLGFTDVKVVYFAHNFGEDWVNKGYPAVSGK
jgi:thiosulfate/3-mercaptopyruvate sulfurtransferase